MASATGLLGGFRGVRKAGNCLPVEEWLTFYPFLKNGIKEAFWGLMEETANLWSTQKKGKHRSLRCRCLFEIPSTVDPGEYGSPSQKKIRSGQHLLVVGRHHHSPPPPGPWGHKSSPSHPSPPPLGSCQLKTLVGQDPLTPSVGPDTQATSQRGIHRAINMTKWVGQLPAPPRQPP